MQEVFSFSYGFQIRFHRFVLITPKTQKLTENSQITFTNSQDSCIKANTAKPNNMNDYKVESANWYTNVKMPNNTEEAQESQASEAATIAVNKFFTGSVRLSDVDSRLTIDSIIQVTIKGTKYLFYSPKILANAGWHEESKLLHEKINADNYQLDA